MQFNERFNFIMFLYILEIAGTHIALVNVAEKDRFLLLCQQVQLSLGYETHSVKLFLISLIQNWDSSTCTCNLPNLLKVKGQAGAVPLCINNSQSHSFNLTHISQARALITGVQRQSFICSGPVNIYLFKMEQLQQERQRLMQCVLVAG